MTSATVLVLLVGSLSIGRVPLNVPAPASDNASTEAGLRLDLDEVRPVDGLDDQTGGAVSIQSGDDEWRCFFEDMPESVRSALRSFEIVVPTWVAP